MLNYRELGQNIRVARKLQHQSQQWLAAQVDISVSFLGHVERGSRKASIETLMRICDVLQLSMDEVLGRVAEQKCLDTVDAKIEALIATLDAAQDIANRLRFQITDFI